MPDPWKMDYQQKQEYCDQIRANGMCGTITPGGEAVCIEEAPCPKHGPVHPSAGDTAQDAQDRLDHAFLLNTIIWMSGSADFSPSGQAGEEWARRREEVYRIMGRTSADGPSVAIPGQNPDGSAHDSRGVSEGGQGPAVTGPGEEAPPVYFGPVGPAAPDAEAERPLCYCGHEKRYHGNPVGGVVCQGSSTEDACLCDKYDQMEPKPSASDGPGVAATNRGVPSGPDAGEGEGEPSQVNRRHSPVQATPDAGADWPWCPPCNSYHAPGAESCKAAFEEHHYACVKCGSEQVGDPCVPRSSDDVSDAPKLKKRDPEAWSEGYWHGLKDGREEVSSAVPDIVLSRLDAVGNFGHDVGVSRLYDDGWRIVSYPSQLTTGGGA